MIATLVTQREGGEKVCHLKWVHHPTLAHQCRDAQYSTFICHQHTITNKSKLKCMTVVWQIHDIRCDSAFSLRLTSLCHWYPRGPSMSSFTSCLMSSWRLSMTANRSSSSPTSRWGCVVKEQPFYICPKYQCSYQSWKKHSDFYTSVKVQLPQCRKCKLNFYKSCI